MWALLPSDLIIAVAERLPIADYARFRAVCTAWSSAVKDFHPCTPSSFPWLCRKRSPLDVNRLSFFDCPEDRYYHLSLPANIFAPGTAVWLVGHRDGWMVFLLRLDDNLRPIVINPLTSTHLPLPSLRNLPCKYQPDISYTIIPYPALNVTFVIYSFPLHTGLAFAGRGDEWWTNVSSYYHVYSAIAVRRMQFIDVVYHDGRFYAVYPSGKMLAFELELSPSSSKAYVVVAENKYLMGSYDLNFTRDVFLVSSPSGGLLQIRMVKYSSDLGPHVVRRRWQRGLVKSFVVMKYDVDADGWVEIKDLGDSCIFVDKCQAMLQPVGDNDRVDDPAWPRLKRNCIYFAGFHCSDQGARRCIYFAGFHCSDQGARRWDVRVYEVGSIAQGNPCSSLQFYNPLFWFRPSFTDA